MDLYAYNSCINKSETIIFSPFYFTAARISLASQNVFVAVCAGVVFVVHFFLDEIKAEWPDELLLKLCFAIVIFLGICADLASVANTIVIERDWIVELCRRDENLLSSK